MTRIPAAARHHLPVRSWLLDSPDEQVLERRLRAFRADPFFVGLGVTESTSERPEAKQLATELLAAADASRALRPIVLEQTGLTRADCRYFNRLQFECDYEGYQLVREFLVAALPVEHRPRTGRVVRALIPVMRSYLQSRAELFSSRACSRLGPEASQAHSSLFLSSWQQAAKAAMLGTPSVRRWKDRVVHAGVYVSLRRLCIAHLYKGGLDQLATVLHGLDAPEFMQVHRALSQAGPWAIQFLRGSIQSRNSLPFSRQAGMPFVLLPALRREYAALTPTDTLPCLLSDEALARCRQALPPGWSLRPITSPEQCLREGAALANCLKTAHELPGLALLERALWALQDPDGNLSCFATEVHSGSRLPVCVIAAEHRGWANGRPGQVHAGVARLVHTFITTEVMINVDRSKLWTSVRQRVSELVESASADEPALAAARTANALLLLRQIGVELPIPSGSPLDVGASSATGS